MKPKTVQQTIDGQERRRPLEKGFGAAIAESKRKPPESAWWHMRHRPYEKEPAKRKEWEKDRESL